MLERFKAYKLIKEYPCSPKLGTIVSMAMCENYPEYWEEVIKKEFEVLTIRRNSDLNKILSVKEYDDSGAFLSKVSINHPSHKEWDFNERKDSRGYIEDNYHIYSVKRLSDGEIFTIGDITSEGIILRFREIHYGRCQYSCREKDNWDYLDYCVKYSYLKITEDNVEVFEGDEYWFFDNRDLNNLNIDIHKVNSASKINTVETVNIKYFSTKEAAEKYILLNKASFSYNDIIKAMKKVGIIRGTMDELTEKIRQILIKEKII